MANDKKLNINQLIVYCIGNWQIAISFIDICQLPIQFYNSYKLSFFFILFYEIMYFIL